MRRLAVPLLAALALSACGAEGSEPRDPFEVADPQGARSTVVRSGPLRLRFERPANWSLSRDAPPRAFTLRSGEALVVAWVYPRTEPLPRRGPSLERAREDLLAEVRRRDPGFQVAGSRVLEVAGAPAVAVTGTQEVSRRKLRVRSLHVYAEGAELVVEALAAEENFERVDSRVLEPLLRSLRVGRAPPA